MRMKLTISINAVKNGPITGTDDSNATLLVKILNKYPTVDATVWNIQIIQPEM
jgi:hypothetical protein